MNAMQMLHDRNKRALQQLLADTSKRRTAKDRARLEAKLEEALAFERANPWVVA